MQDVHDVILCLCLTKRELHVMLTKFAEYNVSVPDLKRLWVLLSKTYLGNLVNILKQTLDHLSRVMVTWK